MKGGRAGAGDALARRRSEKKSTRRVFVVVKYRVQNFDDRRFIQKQKLLFNRAIDNHK